MWCVCAQSYMVQFKKIFDHFICFWKWFLSLFVFMFSVYFVFHCLNMFCVEKTGVRVFRSLAGDSPVTKTQLRVHLEAFGDSLAACSRLAKFSRLNLTTRPVTKLANCQSGTRVKHVGSWRVMTTGALQDKKYSLAWKLSCDSNSWLILVARPSRQNVLFGWKLTFHIPYIPYYKYP